MAAAAKLTKHRFNFVMRHMRRASRFWPPAAEALKKARVGPNQYKCNKCKKLFKKTEVHRDHILPVIDVKKGRQSIATYLKRLLPSSKGYQILCKPCHKKKTELENKERK